MQQGFEHHEIAQAKTKIRDTALDRYRERAVAPREDDPEFRCAEFGFLRS